MKTSTFKQKDEFELKDEYDFSKCIRGRFNAFTKTQSDFSFSLLIGLQHKVPTA